MINNLFGLPFVSLNKISLKELLLDVSKELPTHATRFHIDNDNLHETLFSDDKSFQSPKDALYSLGMLDFRCISPMIKVPIINKSFITKKVFKEMVRNSSNISFKDLRVAGAFLSRRLQEQRLTPYKFIIHLNKLYCIPDQRYTGVYAEKEGYFGFALYLPNIACASLEEGWDYEDDKWCNPQA